MRCVRWGCTNEGTVRWGRNIYCARCSKINHMLRNTHHDYPDRAISWAEIDALLKGAEAADLICPHCKDRMFYDLRAGRKHIATIQHYRDGSLGIICFGCNAKHGRHKLGDAVYLIPEGHKSCSTCARVLPLAAFGSNRSTVTGRSHECRECVRRTQTERRQKRRM